MSEPKNTKFPRSLEAQLDALREPLLAAVTAKLEEFLHTTLPGVIEDMVAAQLDDAMDGWERDADAAAATLTPTNAAKTLPN
jgi:hypothetical protein